VVHAPAARLVGFPIVNEDLVAAGALDDHAATNGRVHRVPFEIRTTLFEQRHIFLEVEDFKGDGRTLRTGLMALIRRGYRERRVADIVLDPLVRPTVCVIFSPRTSS